MNIKIAMAQIVMEFVAILLFSLLSFHCYQISNKLQQDRENQFLAKPFMMIKYITYVITLGLIIFLLRDIFKYWMSFVSFV